MPPQTSNIKSSKPKPSTGKKGGATKSATKKTCEQHASKSEDDREELQSTEKTRNRKKRARRDSTTSKEEVEQVDDKPVAQPPIEHVNDIIDMPNQCLNNQTGSVHITISLKQ